MDRDMVAFIALDQILGRLSRSVMHVSLEPRVGSDLLGDDSANPLTRPASEFHLTWSPILNALCIEVAQSHYKMRSSLCGPLCLRLSFLPAQPRCNH